MADVIHDLSAPTPHLEAGVGDFAETILLPGDPLRAKFIAETYLEDARLVNSVRGILGYTGTYQGKPVSVMGTGMGCPSMGIYSWELMHIYGCKNLIRIGTAGSLQPHLRVKDMIFALGVCTTSSYAEAMKLPGDFCPICSYELLERAVANAGRLGYSYYVGNVVCNDIFYRDPVPQGKSWSDMGVLASEMESLALYVNAAQAGANALCIATISDAPGVNTTAEERQTAFTQMMEVALSLA